MGWPLPGRTVAWVFFPLVPLCSAHGAQLFQLLKLFQLSQLGASVLRPWGPLPAGPY